MVTLSAPFHSPKNLSMALSAEVAEIIEYLTNDGCSNVVSAVRTETTQWHTEEQSKTLHKINPPKLKLS